MKNVRILVIDDDASIRDSLELFLERLGCAVVTAEDGTAGLAAFRRQSFDLVIADIRMPGKSGFDVLSEIHELDAEMPVIMITAFDDMQLTINAMQRGAREYIEKPIDIERLRQYIESIVQTRRMHAQHAIEIDAGQDFASSYQLIGNSAGMKAIFKRIGQVSVSNATVLIQGESGTGKELIARIIHENSALHTRPFIGVNCSALPDGLLESELFGHVRGAFTGAVRDKKGKFELAGEGTIFLDEISEISPGFQAKILRVLQEREFVPVGGEQSVPVSARVIAATNRDLEQLVREGRFRDDLYYRLDVFRIDVPPLRDRAEDIPQLVMHLVRKFNREMRKNVFKVSFDVIEMLKRHDWPGNVRELENTLSQAMITVSGGMLDPSHIVLHRAKSADAAALPDDPTLSLAEVEERHIRLVLDYVDGDKSQACDILGISRPTLYKKIREYGLDSAGANEPA